MNRSSIKPGGTGRGAVFICPVCGNKFVRTLPGQNKCTACLKKEQQLQEAETENTEIEKGGTEEVPP